MSFAWGTPRLVDQHLYVSEKKTYMLGVTQINININIYGEKRTNTKRISLKYKTVYYGARVKMYQFLPFQF